MKTLNEIKIETALPLFTGYYCNDLYDTTFAEELVTDIFDDDMSDNINFNYEDFYERVSKELTSSAEQLILAELGLDIKFKYQRLDRPKFYNFRDDIIEVEISFTNETFIEIKRYLEDNKKEFQEYLENYHTSCDGFISFVSNDVEVWLNEYLKLDYEKVSRVFNSVLEFMLKNEGLNEDDLVNDNVQEELSYIDYEIEY